MLRTLPRLPCNPLYRAQNCRSQVQYSMVRTRRCKEQVVSPASPHLYAIFFSLSFFASQLSLNLSMLCACLPELGNFPTASWRPYILLGECCLACTTEPKLPSHTEKMCLELQRSRFACASLSSRLRKHRPAKQSHAAKVKVHRLICGLAVFL